jgi:hypothetical protein
MNFERFMKSMDEDMEQQEVPDVVKQKWIVEWFSGEALSIVEAKLNNNVNEDASVTHSSIKDALQDAYGVEDRDFCANAIITQLVPFPVERLDACIPFEATGADPLASFTEGVSQPNVGCYSSCAWPVGQCTWKR